MRASLRVAALAAALVACPWVAAADTLSAGGMRGIPIMIEPQVLFHTLASDFFTQPDGTIYVQTGDIPAMWLRDSAAQTLPYVRLARDRPLLRRWIRAVIAREVRNIAIDPYANAFRSDYRVWERKWEIDSLAYPVVLVWAYVDALGDRSVYTPALHRALERVVATYECERRHDSCSRYRAPSSPSAANGVPDDGLIWSAFRASDDPTRYGYNIPEEMFAVTALHDLGALAIEGFGDRELGRRATALADGMTYAIAHEGIVDDFDCGGKVYAYEIDGRGRFVFFDDANLPSLLGAPLTGYPALDASVYARTRACVLSKRDPYYYSGRFAAGVGSAHTPKGYVWPLALIARALTSSDRVEVLRELRALADSVGRDHLVHESFDPDDPAHFTRAEFGWANAMYAELLFRTAAGFPAQRLIAPDAEMGNDLVPETITVVDPATALANRGALLAAFDRAVPRIAAPRRTTLSRHRGRPVPATPERRPRT
jgi:meiotically up-regulated gene 157 (Mug157) protein